MSYIRNITNFTWSRFRLMSSSLFLIIATFQLLCLPTCSRLLPFRLSYRKNSLFNIHSYLLFNLCLSTELTITMIELLIELIITMPQNSQLNSFIYEAIIPWNLMLWKLISSSLAWCCLFCCYCCCWHTWRSKRGDNNNKFEDISQNVM